VRATTGQVSVSIRDSGIGIAAGDVSKLFVPFGRIVTPQNAHIGGTGLGLYLAREILRQHGGDITVRSVAGRGSTFRCTLPTVQAESAKNGLTPNEAGIQRPVAGDRGLAATTFRSATKAPQV
jgi:signal transduction histidine kinase